MIAYLVKLLIDKPIIQYLEDPLAPSERAGWKKLIVIDKNINLNMALAINMKIV